MVFVLFWFLCAITICKSAAVHHRKFPSHVSSHRTPFISQFRQNYDSSGRCKIHRSSIYGYRALKYISYLFPRHVEGKKLVRVGGGGDGTYTMLNDFSNVTAAYGFGVGYDWTWDEDLASRGIDVFMFDPSIKTPKVNNFRVKFYPLGIAVSDVSEKRMYSLESILKLNKNLKKSNMIFKIDIEGGEWDILHSIPSSILEKFSQILIEFHWFDAVILSEEMFNIGLEVFEKLNRTHQLIWVHACNIHPYDVFGGVPFPRIIESAWVKRTNNMKFIQARREQRVNERSTKSNGEFLLWWVEGGSNVDIAELLEFYKTQ